MGAIAKKREQDLDRMWGQIKYLYALKLQFVPDSLGVTRRELEVQTGQSYATIYRLTALLLEEGSITEHWTHSHQSHWEAHYKPVGETLPAILPYDDVSDIPF